MKFIFVILICFLNIWPFIKADAQGTGFELLTTGPNSEALSLGEATTAYLLGASSIYTNPANLAFEYSSSFNADYTLWIGGITNTHAAINFKKENSAIAFGLLASEASDFELRNRPGPSQGSFSVSYLSLSGGYAYAYRNFSLGASFQYLREELYIYNASGYSVNAGVSSHWFGRRLFVSASVKNIGKMDELNTEETELPGLARGGIYAKLFNLSAGQNDFPITFALLSDIVIPLKDNEANISRSSAIEENINLNIGLSVVAAEIVSLRAGYKTGDTARHLSFGTGILFENITANYAIVPFETGFGTVHSIGLGYKF